MKKTLLGISTLGFFLLGVYLIHPFFIKQTKETGAPPNGVAEETAPSENQFTWLKDWKRPEGPVKVALQVGHWKNDQVPEELHNLSANTGASGGGEMEWEVNYQIASDTAKLLQEKGITVDILPATVPPQYFADAFVAIHADGSDDPAKSGYKVASSWRDFSGKASTLVSDIENAYQSETGFDKDPNITKNMRGYYAFSWWRYEHAIHPMTTAAILETGFLTNPEDRKIIVDHPEISAEGLANGIITFLKSQNLLKT